MLTALVHKTRRKGGNVKQVRKLKEIGEIKRNFQSEKNWKRRKKMEKTKGKGKIE